MMAKGPILPAVNCRYGAPLGRGQSHAIDRSAPIRFHLVRVRLNSGGYDSGGAYWGFGRPLYWASAEEIPAQYDRDYVDRFYRADDRDDAKAQVRAEYPNARFYR